MHCHAIQHGGTKSAGCFITAGSMSENLPGLCLTHLMSTHLPRSNWDRLLDCLIASSLTTFSCFPISFANSDPLCLLQYSRYNIKAFVLSLLPQGYRRCRGWRGQSAECVWVSDRQKRNKVRRTTSENTAAQHFSAASGQQAIFQRRDRNRTGKKKAGWTLKDICQWTRSQVADPIHFGDLGVL